MNTTRQAETFKPSIIETLDELQVGDWVEPVGTSVNAKWPKRIAAIAPLEGHPWTRVVIDGGHYLWRSDTTFYVY